MTISVTSQADVIRPPHKAWYSQLYVQVLCAVAAGILLGAFFPSAGESMKPLGDAPGEYVKVKV